jgi:hypothetical protein
MPPAQVGPDALRALGAALGSLRDCARSGADEVLDHLPEVGDRELQTVLDDHLDQVADLLREVDASVADVAGRLRVAAARTPTSGASTGREPINREPTASQPTTRGPSTTGSAITGSAARGSSAGARDPR